MIFKVYFQPNKNEVAIREYTQTIYVEANSEQEVRTKIKDLPYNVEYVQAVSEAYYEYEITNNQDYKVLELG